MQRAVSQNRVFWPVLRAQFLYFFFPFLPCWRLAAQTSLRPVRDHPGSEPRIDHGQDFGFISFRFLSCCLLFILLFLSLGECYVHPPCFFIDLAHSPKFVATPPPPYLTLTARLSVVTAARISLQERQICKLNPNRHDRKPSRTHSKLQPTLR